MTPEFEIYLERGHYREPGPCIQAEMRMVGGEARHGPLIISKCHATEKEVTDELSAIAAVYGGTIVKFFDAYYDGHVLQYSQRKEKPQ